MINIIRSLYEMTKSVPPWEFRSPKLEFFLNQTGLINKVLAVTHMTDCNGCDTPSTVDPLHADIDGAAFEETWAYDIVIGMLMYISGNTRPDIAYAVHQAARFTCGA